MKKLSLMILSVLFFAYVASAQAKKKADKDTEEWRYEIEPVQTGSQGTYLIKVWSYSKKPNVAIEQAKKNAIHGIIFRGFSAKDRVEGKPALTNNPNLEMEKQEFFTDFFADGGKYMKFVNVTGDGSVAAEDRLKVGKEYKIGVVVSINVGLLRKDLEAAAVIKGLSAGF
jgi:hypothetical protein